MSGEVVSALVSAGSALIGAVLGSASAIIAIGVQHRLAAMSAARVELRNAYSAWFYGCMRALADQIELRGAMANPSIGRSADVIVPLATRARESMHLRAQAVASLALLENSRQWLDRVVKLTETDWFFQNQTDPLSTFQTQENLAKQRESELLAFIHEVREAHPVLCKT